MHFHHFWLSSPVLLLQSGRTFDEKTTLSDYIWNIPTIYQHPVQKHDSRSRVVLIAWQCWLRPFVSSIILSSSTTPRLSLLASLHLIKPKPPHIHPPPPPSESPLQNRHKQAAGSAGSQGLFLRLSTQVPSVAFVLRFFSFKALSCRAGVGVCVSVGE